MNQGTETEEERAAARKAAEKYGQYIPDKLLLRDARRRLIAVYNPAWWRLDRHVFWLLKRLFGSGRRGHATFTAVVTGSTSEVVVFELPVYEIDEDDDPR